MKIAYVTTYDSSDINAWSGTGISILSTLQNSGFQAKCIGNLIEEKSILFSIKKALYGKVFQKRYLRDRDSGILKSYATQVETALKNIDCDVIFSPGTIPIAYLQSEKPIVFWTDTTFAGMVDFYPEYSNLCSETIRNGNKMEQLALSKCRLAIYSSEWAAKTAIENYDVDPGKVKVVPFGANISCERDFQEIDSMIRNKKMDICKLLFVGVDWVRKGGEKALAVAELLNRRGIKTELHIVGCNPPTNLPDYVKLHGFISKKSQEGRSLLGRLLFESHFLMLPTIADCVPVVFAEASSFGLPSLATRVGGIPTAIHDGRNGQTFALDESSETYCDYIERFMSSGEAYYELALSSFKEYSERLNWQTAGSKVYDLIQETQKSA